MNLLKFFDDVSNLTNQLLSSASTWYQPKLLVGVVPSSVTIISKNQHFRFIH